MLRCPSAPHETGGVAILNWAVIFFMIALIAAFFGFGGIVTTSAGIAQILFYVFLLLFVAALLANARCGLGPRM